MIDARIPTTSERKISVIALGFEIYFNQRRKRSVPKIVSHISNVPKWENCVNPILKVAKNAAKSPVFLSLSFSPRTKRSGIRKVAKSAE